MPASNLILCKMLFSMKLVNFGEFLHYSSLKLVGNSMETKHMVKKCKTYISLESNSIKLKV